MTSHPSTSIVDDLKEGQVDTVETKARYLAYAARLRPILLASHRYLAYTSDIGEAFRPISGINGVRLAYGISWAYLTFDVGYEAYKSKLAGNDNTQVATTALKRTVFQVIASMALPAFTIHSVVKYSAKAVRDVKSPALKSWGPTSLGLLVVPFLPYMFDHPVEHVLDKVFETIEEKVSGGEKRILEIPIKEDKSDEKKDA